MTYNYFIEYSKSAKEDLTHIYITGSELWGNNAADLYLQHIVLQCALLASQPQLGGKGMKFYLT